MLRTQTGNQKNGAFLQMFSDITFHPETFSQTGHIQPNIYDYSCEKDS